MRTALIVAAAVVVALGGVLWLMRGRGPGMGESDGEPIGEKVVKSEEQWREQLGSEEYHVTRQCGTERPFANRYWDCKDDGVYECVCCGQPLFDSETKFDSGTGWPSYYEPMRDGAVARKVERSLFAPRTEVTCSRCGAHLGHVFDDGPPPTGLRYCMNSAALRLKARPKK